MDGKQLRQLAADPAAFRAAIRIDAGGCQRPFREVVEPWQQADFRALDAGLRAVAGQKVDHPCLRCWLERPRGHSKTSDIALSVAWLLFASRRPLKIAAAAADADQAGLLRDAVQRLVTLNPWLSELLEIQRSKIVNKHTNSVCEIIASDAPSSYGLLCDAIIADEICHWQRRDLWDSLLSTAAKRARCLLLCITNAGFESTWVWPVREAVRTDPAWHFSRLDGPVATWITADRLDEQRRLLPAPAYERLWLNRWSAGAGDALAERDVLQAVDDALAQHPVDRESYCAGLDIGLRRDATALVVVGKDRGGHLSVRCVRRWQAAEGGEVQLQAIEDAIVDLHAEFHFKRVAMDPWQGSHLCQRLNRRGVPVAERSQSGNHLTEQAMALIEAIRDHRISLPDRPELLTDLRRARIQERSYGFRLESPRDETGHGDTLSALSIALAEAKTLRGGSTAFHFDPAEWSAAAERWDAVMRDVDKRVDEATHHIARTDAPPVQAASRGPHWAARL